MMILASIFAHMRVFISSRLDDDAKHWHQLWSIRLTIFWSCFNGAVMGLYFLTDIVNPLALFALCILGYATIGIARVYKQPGLD